ncbi:MAG: tail fiber protein [Planctomycetaceae bacterium]
MAQPYVGEIRIFAGNFAPAGWNFCDGSLLSIAENETLFNLIGTTYGGDGQSTFGVPDLRGRVPVHMGSGFTIGQAAGAEEVTIGINEMPGHNHPFIASQDGGTQPTPVGFLAAASNVTKIYKASPPTAALAASAAGPAGGSQPHENMQPYIVINYIISLFGIFPSPT